MTEKELEKILEEVTGKYSHEVDEFYDLLRSDIFNIPDQTFDERTAAEIKPLLCLLLDWKKKQLIKNSVPGDILGDIRNQETEPYRVYAESDDLDLAKYRIGDKVNLVILDDNEI